MTPAPALKGAPFCLVVQELTQRDAFSGTAHPDFSAWHGFIGSIVVRHPKGTLVIDPSFSERIREDLELAPWITHVLLGEADTKTPLLTALKDTPISLSEIKEIALSHTHWDHTGGVRDLPGIPVRMSRVEAEWALKLEGQVVNGTMPHALKGEVARIAPFDFEGPPMLGFPASHDLFGDGTVIAVPLYGHTPGSTGYLLTNESGARFLYVGDAAWMHRGVDEPVMKNPLLPIDFDAEKTAETLGRLHAAGRDNRDLTVLTAHDLIEWIKVPMCREWK